ncbi:tapasin-related protein isoform X1 [Hypanus sabinus]|uniref:tapasin-related protein isoform X1 n=1 Tax=Hypanus sabinus TaxID=79690 RepID=UPI0028C3ABFA|nr:tapasin-related protein isoform X1 [Hypanus sabinus]
MYFFAALGGNQLVGIIFTTVSLITADEVFQVIQTPQRTSLTVGENAIFSCTISSSEDTSNVNIYWWKLGEVNLIQPDSRKHIDSGEEKGSLQLLNISIADSGVYHCGIKFRGVDVANGSGSQLIVSASPTPLQILRNRGQPSTLFCNMAPFYPAGVTIVWYKNNKTISNGINTTQRLNNAGMYEASSTLHDAQLAQSGSVYTCLASHVTLKIPAMAIYLVPNFNPDRDAWTSTNFYLKVFGSTGFALTLFLLMVITRIPFRFISCRDR